MLDAPDFDPKTAGDYEIIARAEAMRGRTLGELADSRWAADVSSKLNKGGAGAIVERYFGIKPNSDQAPDFATAGVELKVCPLVMDGASAKRIKERTSVTMIDYLALDRETWPTASVRGKIARILFVFYGWRPDIPLGEMRVEAVKLWAPPETMLPILERDWLTVWHKNRNGLAHELSEGDGLILGAVTKGATGAMREQPHSPIPAKSRAWSLKPKLTWTIYSGTRGQDLESELIAKLLSEAPTDPVDALAHRLEPLVGLTITQVAEQHGIAPGMSKNRVSSVIRQAIGLRSKRLPEHLEALGLEIKTIPLGPNANPYEAMSFPAFDPRELADEDWEDSDLLASIQNMLLVPVYRDERRSDLMEQRLCKPFRWSADREQLSGIRAEWERFRDLFSSGKADALPTEAVTRFIHVRPHGRDGTDRVEAPGALVVPKQSFWLNREFVRELVLSHHSDWQGF